jgi:hypothetical protein
MSCAQNLDGVRVDTSSFILVRVMQSPTSSRGGWDLYYSHLSACSRDYKHNGRGKVLKSLELIEASANILRLSGKRVFACVSACPLEELSCPIYTPRRCMLRSLGRRIPRGDVLVSCKPTWQCTSLLTYAHWFPAESRGRGRGDARTPEPSGEGLPIPWLL